jgi:LacI family transcriptional regulator
MVTVRNVPLTGVRLDEWQQGYAAAAALHGILTGAPAPRAVVRVPPIGIIRRASTGVATSSDPLVAKALHLIREHPVGLAGVDDLVGLLGVSRRTLEQRFRRGTDSTLHKLIVQRQLGEAKRLLRSGGLTLEQVARQCGYTSVQYFATAFKRETRMTPGEYRARHH